MGAGKDGEREDGRVDGGEVVAGSVRKARREHDRADGEDLDGGVDFPQHRRPETTKSRDDVDGCGANQNEDVAADDGYCYPKRHRKM